MRRPPRSPATAMLDVLTPVLQWRRVQEIVTVLWSSGFGWLVDAMGLRACVSLRCRLVCSFGTTDCPHHIGMDRPRPRRIVAVLESLGPTYVKVGQLLATRTDYLPAEYAEALQSLQDDVSPFPGEEARRLVEAELHRPLADVFAEFDDVPIAAASLSQVHRARLRDGTEVAVKVQRAGVQALIESDLALLGWMARRLERRRGAALPFRPTTMVAELTEHTRRELDFRNEARTAETIGRTFTADDGVVIPRVHWAQTTPRVLTMDMVHGHRPAPRAELAARGLDADRLLEVGARAMLRQVFELGIFHADPHPGNLLMLEGDRVCFLDFGLYGRLDRRERRRMAMVLYSLVKGDYESVSDQLLHVSEVLPGADVRAFRRALAELVEDWYGQRPTEFSVARLLLHELGLGAQYGVVFPRELVLLARALVHLEATAALVDPELGFADLIGPLLPELRSTLLPGRAEMAELWHVTWMDYLALAMELPAALPHLAGRRLPGAADPAAAPDTARRGDLGRTGSAASATAAGLVAGALAGAFVAQRWRRVG